MLEVSMVVPLLNASPVCAVDLEGDLTPTSPTCSIDLLQIYVPNADGVFLVHCASLPKQPLAELLGPWLASSAHTKLLCDGRADADAIQHLYGVRLAGVVDVQLCHAAAVGELSKYQAASRGTGAFFFPTGLARLTATYCPRELSVAISALKDEFGAHFDAGRAPFRALPMMPGAAAYAAADVWTTFLVYDAIWPTLVQNGLTESVAQLSEARAGEFRDTPGGRERWEAAIAQQRAAKAERRASGGSPAKAAAAPLNGTTNAVFGATAIPANWAPPAGGGLPAAAPSALTAAAPARPPKEPRPKLEPKPRTVSGPECVCCAIRFSSAAQLAEHEKGKRHLAAFAASQRPTPTMLAVECRQAPLEAAAVSQAFGSFGGVARVALSQTDPSGQRKAQDKPDRPGPWFATLQFQDNAAAARAIGAGRCYVGEHRVYVEVLDEQGAAGAGAPQEWKW